MPAPRAWIGCFLMALPLLSPAASLNASENAVPQPAIAGLNVDWQSARYETKSLHFRVYRDLARRLQSQGEDFSSAFVQLTALLRSRARGNPVRQRLEVSSLFLGLIQWTRNGGQPAFQGRGDLALHFIYGGYLAGQFGMPLAKRAAYERERQNAGEPGNAFDLDDYGATLMGAYWAATVGGLRSRSVTWVDAWASGERTLKDLPKLAFGQVPFGLLPNREAAATVDHFARHAIDPTYLPLLSDPRVLERFKREAGLLCAPAVRAVPVD
ncbi:MAG: hypothetical protein ABII00_02860 [Elusimicrobiota bacterium]